MPEQFSGDDRVLLATLFVVGLLVGAGGATAYFVANPVVETEYKTVYSTVEKPVSDDGVVFTIRSGPTAPSDWSYPVRVEFRRPSGSNWTTQYMAKVTEGESFLVGLENSTRYQIAVTDSLGQTRILGSFYPQDSSDEVELVIGPCCDDYKVGDRRG